jgi:hypothetical protein
MPIDFQQITHKIREIGAGARERRERLARLRAHARDLLDRHGEQLDFLRGIVEQAKGVDPNIRCAFPLAEPLTAHHPAPETSHPVEATLIAADGSQINPDRHAAVQFGLINVGAIIMRMESETSPDIFTNSELLYGDELETTFGTMSEGMIALRRDLEERSQLVELSARFEAPVVTFTDGPIELWSAGDGGQASVYLESLAKYKSVLSRLQEHGVITAGYVDKPSADLVLRLLELVDAQKDQPSSLREYHPLRGISDRWLFGEKTRPLLGPGERSAVFAIQSKSEKDYQGVLALHFFYLNVGTQGHPWPVRVEIPGWVAGDTQKLDLLHAVLVEQCRIMGSKPYPYLLHRAHEVAVVKQEEKYQIEQMLIQELRLQDEELDESSGKSSAKGLQGRTRM